ncbi:hypothetical protein EVAR_29742_1 [Eumeta japonica]|uniref:Uncharacterized protein n=1 Tax=Eumeta variegata TaxID=151549 RepID=A0A4C1VYU1_EUMVA|nr:hypothetical protein EVAR_29742_1 [Eumeta japonica]
MQEETVRRAGRVRRSFVREDPVSSEQRCGRAPSQRLTADERFDKKLPVRIGVRFEIKELDLILQMETYVTLDVQFCSVLGLLIYLRYFET